MNLPWFRMYGEFLTDPLIRLLSFEDQRHFIAALCMKSQGVTDKRYASVTVRRNVISSLIGLSAEVPQGGVCALDQANERLRALGLIDAEWQPINWDKRQFQSDHVDKTAAERMRRYRANRNVTPVTPVVTAVDQNRYRTDTDTEQSRGDARGKPRAERSAATYLPDDFSLTEERKSYASALNLNPEEVFENFRLYWKGAGGQKARKRDWEATWQGWCRRDADNRKQASKPRKTRFEELTEHLNVD